MSRRLNKYGTLKISQILLIFSKKLAESAKKNPQIPRQVVTDGRKIFNERRN